MELTILEMTFAFSAPVIEAIAESVSALVALVGLPILAYYAWDTHRLAKVAVEQANESLVPYLSVRVNNGMPAGPLGYSTLEPSLVNNGKGPALGVLLSGVEAEYVYVNFRSEIKGWKENSEALGDIAPGDEARLPDWTIQSFFGNKEFRVTYSSLEGDHFRTTYTVVGPVRGRLTFERFGRKAP